MRAFQNYKGETCFLSQQQEEHIHSRHPDATLGLIQDCLQDPIEVRKSSSNNIAQLYYIIRKDGRFFCVVLKVCHDGNFISTAYTTIKIKRGHLVYKKEL